MTAPGTTHAHACRHARAHARTCTCTRARARAHAHARACARACVFTRAARVAPGPPGGSGNRCGKASIAPHVGTGKRGKTRAIVMQTPARRSQQHGGHGCQGGAERGSPEVSTAAESGRAGQGTAEGTTRRERRTEGAGSRSQWLQRGQRSTVDSFPG